MYSFHLLTRTSAEFSAAASPYPRVINSGVITEINGDTFIFQYTYSDRAWQTRIRVTDATRFFTTTLLTDEEGVSYGREQRAASRDALTEGTPAVVEWAYNEAYGRYTAHQVFFVSPDMQTLIY